MRVLIYNFDAINPLAHEWAHILVNQKITVSLVNHRQSIKCNLKNLDIHSLEDFKLRMGEKYDIIFLPWIPPRRELLRFIANWIKCGFAEIFWIDHNPIHGRDREGLILKFLRNTKNHKIHKITHGAENPSETYPNTNFFPHPIFQNAFENTNYKKTKRVNNSLNFAFIGRLDEQKGLHELPRLASRISSGIKVPTNWIIAGNNPNMTRVFDVIESIQKLPNVSVEPYVYGKNCPDEFILHALLEADFLFAPYKLVTASGTISLALALDTEIICLSQSVPAGLENFKNGSLHCIDEENLIEFLKGKINYNSNDPLHKKMDIKKAIEIHNQICGEIFLLLAKKIRKNWETHNE